MRRGKVKGSYPISARDMTRYRRKARDMSLFHKDCALLGIDFSAFQFQPAALVEPMGYHKPMEFVSQDDQLPPPRREFSGMNADE